MTLDIDTVDVSLAGLDHSTVDRLLSQYRADSIARICQLSPLQEGLLFETLKAPDDGNYLTQTVFETDQDLDAETFVAAWRFVCGRHEALRTTFVVDDVPRPVQIVHRSTPAQVRTHDWRGVTTRTQAERLERLLREHRHRDPELATAPPVAFDVIRTGTARAWLVWHAHHLLIDGESSARVLGELSHAYACLASGGDLPALPRPAQFCEHLAWLLNRDQAQDIEEWRKVVGDLSEPTPLSCIAPPSEGPGRPSRSVVRAAGGGVVATLSEFAARHNCTLHTLLQAAWALVLSSRSGRPDPCWGTIFSGRSAGYPRVDDVVGLVINTVPVRARLDPGETVGSWLSGLQRTLSTVHRLEHVGLDSIRRASSLTGTDPMFETLFEFVPEPASGGGRPARLELRRTVVHEQSGYPLSVSAVLRGGELVLDVQFEPARVEEDVARQVADQYLHLLLELVRNEDTVLSQLELLSADERDRLRAWSRSSRWVDLADTIPDVFARVVAEFGEHTAVIDGDGVLSYQELDSRSDVVAGRLTALGLHTEEVVAVSMPRTADLIPVLFGILKGGGAFLYLDPDVPEERQRFMVDDCGVTLVVSEAGYGISELPEQCTVLDPAGLLPAVADADPQPGPPAVISPDNLAYVTYTSGSTGIPKCVGFSHRNLLRVGCHSDYLPSGPNRRYALLSQIAFDISVEEIWAAVLNGASLVMPGRSPRLDLPDIADLIQRYAVTNFSMTAGLFHQFVDEHLDAFAGVRSVAVGGEAARRSQWDRVLARYPELSLVNSYGPTEMSVTISTETVEYQPHAVVPIGRPIPNTTAYVLDEHLRMVPSGAIGHLYAGGPGVTRGYLSDPGLTAERYLPDPFSADPGERMYATGDLVRWLPDGRLQFIGRADRQVKVRGYRVELGEIEAALAVHPAVSDSAVETIEDDSGLRRLVAYVVPVPGTEVSPASIRSFLADRLPGYMVPSLFTMLGKLPLTSIGKVDRSRLPRDVEPVRVAGASRKASSPTERVLAAAWERVLGIKDPEIEDSFFDLGGDSILAMRVASAVRREGLVVSSQDLFKYQSIGELASAVDMRGKPVPADQRPVVGEVRLTPIQRMFLEQYGALDHFNQSRLLRWPGAVSEDAMRQAVMSLMGHHDTLRLRISRDGASWRQWFTAVGGEDPLQVHDLGGVPDADLESALRNVGAAVQGGLDLRGGPVFRAALLRTGSEKGDLLLLAIHHLAVDLVSWNVLLEDLASAYRFAAVGEAVTLPAKTSSFKAWSDYLHNALSALGPERHWSLVGERSAGSALAPADQNAADSASRTGSVKLTLSPQETERFLRATRGAVKVSGLELVLSALTSSLREWGCTGCVQVDLEAHGREPGSAGLDVTRTVGWFTTMYPITLDTQFVNTFGGYVVEVRDQIQRDPQGALGYGVAKYLSGTDGARLDFPDSEVCFNYLGEVGPGDVFDGLFTVEPGTLGAESGHDGDPPHPLTINVGLDKERLFADIVYARRRWRPETVQALAEYYLGQIRRSIGQLATWELDRTHPSSWVPRLRPSSPLLTAPMKLYRVPGISVATITEGRVEAWAHGASGRPGHDVDVHTRFPVGSVSKHLAAITVMRLGEAGVMSVDQPVDDLPIALRLPAFAGGGPLTVRHLLSHRSGLAEDGRGGYRAVSAPGETYEYFMPNGYLVEQLIAEITGMTFAESLAEHVFGPLGLCDSELLPLYPDESAFSRTAAGHTATGRRYERPRRGGGPDYVDLWSSAADVARVGADLHRAIARDEGVLLSRASALGLLAGLRSGYGLGTVVRELNSRLWIGHPGDGPGFRTIYAIDAHEGYGLVILANGDGATPMFEDLLVELGTELIMRVQGPLMVWEKE